MKLRINVGMELEESYKCMLAARGSTNDLIEYRHCTWKFKRSIYAST